jgi:hypothetical protein
VGGHGQLAVITGEAGTPTTSGQGRITIIFNTPSTTLQTNKFATYQHIAVTN